jgi:hypothetical protein
VSLPVCVNQRGRRSNQLLVKRVISMKIANVFAVVICAYLGSERCAFSMQIRMAYQRHTIDELIFVRMDHLNLNEFYACDPDGYYHRITKRNAVGKMPSKILKIERSQVLLEIPYLGNNGEWLSKKQWKKIVPHLSKDDKCPLTKEDKKMLGILE